MRMFNNAFGARTLIPVIALGALLGCSGAKQTTTEKAPPAKPVWFRVDPATAGVLNGRIEFTGKKPHPKRIDVSEDPLCAAMHKNGLYDESLVVNGNGTLANVFIYI